MKQCSFLGVSSIFYTAISHAMARDGSSGGVIRMVIIDSTGVEKEVILGEFLYLYHMVHVLEK